jgi:hypothetical protein
MTPLKASLKRGVLVTAANWQVVIIQFVADALFKTLLAVPIVGGVFLVVLLVGGDPSELLDLPVRSIIPTMASVLLAQPLALGAFLFSVAIVLVGGSLLMFFVKGGTVTVLVAAERAGGAIEHPPLRMPAFRRASQFSLERFAEGTQALFRRYVVIGAGLMVMYGVTTLASLSLLLDPAPDANWAATALLSLTLVGWVTVVNWIYLLLQMVVGADDCSVPDAVWRVAGLLRSRTKLMLSVFAATLVFVVLTTAASILATAALGLIAFVPFIGLAALPLQLVAWAVRGIVFEFIGLTALVAYLRIYAGTKGEAADNLHQIGRTA